MGKLRVFWQCRHAERAGVARICLTVPKQRADQYKAWHLAAIGQLRGREPKRDLKRSGRACFRFPVVSLRGRRFALRATGLRIEGQCSSRVIRKTGAGGRSTGSGGLAVIRSEARTNKRKASRTFTSRACTGVSRPQSIAGASRRSSILDSLAREWLKKTPVPRNRRAGP